MRWSWSARFDRKSLSGAIVRQDAEEVFNLLSHRRARGVMKTDAGGDGARRGRPQRYASTSYRARLLVRIDTGHLFHKAEAVRYGMLALSRGGSTRESFLSCSRLNAPKPRSGTYTFTPPAWTPR